MLAAGVVKRAHLLLELFPIENTRHPLAEHSSLFHSDPSRVLLLVQTLLLIRNNFLRAGFKWH